RTLLKPYPEIAVTIGKTIPFADTLFIESMYALIRSHRDGKVDLSHPAVMSFLNEIGVKEITVEEEAYAPRVYIRTWTGHKMPLERAPSGMREILAILFALFSKDAPAVLLVEEPEAHLHPRALLYLARVIAVSVNRFGKNVILSTHSDVLVAEVNNLIAVSSKPEKMSKLGYSKDEVLDPGAVAAYLIKPEETTASVVELKTTETGFDESIFEEVARELMERRAEALE
ncbi:MAG: AAA family ATPase, partial [Candidatus Baldrarchaeia archaeon]